MNDLLFPKDLDKGKSSRNDGLKEMLKEMFPCNLTDKHRQNGSTGTEPVYLQKFL